MQVNRIGSQPNFQAKFIKNSAALQVANKEINNGRDEELVKALSELDKHHRNVALLITRNENHYTITNLYNGNKVPYAELTSENIEELSDIKSYEYKRLFIGEKVITPAKADKMANAVADKYFVKAAPDYTIGHIVDQSI